MTIEVGAGLSLLISVVTFLGLGVSVVTFFMKLKWNGDQHEKEIELIKTDVDRIGQKLDKKNEEMIGRIEKVTVDLTQKILEHSLNKANEISHMMVRIDAMDKAIIKLSSDMNHVVDTVKELKDRLFKSA